MAANGGIKEFFRWDNLWDNPRTTPGQPQKMGQPQKNLGGQQKSCPEGCPASCPMKKS